MIVALAGLTGCYHQTTSGNDTSAPHSKDPGDSPSDLDTDSKNGEGDSVLPAADTETVSAPELPCCLVAHVRWMVDCGQDHLDPWFVLHRCDEVIKDPPFACAPELASCGDDALIDPHDLNALLKREDVREAFQGEAQSYGAYSDPLEHILVSYEEGEESHALNVGQPCETNDADCAPIPEGLARLRTLLDTVALQRDDYPVATEDQSHIACEYHLR